MSLITSSYIYIGALFNKNQSTQFDHHKKINISIYLHGFCLPFRNNIITISSRSIRTIRARLIKNTKSKNKTNQHNEVEFLRYYSRIYKYFNRFTKQNKKRTWTLTVALLRVNSVTRMRPFVVLRQDLCSGVSPRSFCALTFTDCVFVFCVWANKNIIIENRQERKKSQIARLKLKISRTFCMNNWNDSMMFGSLQLTQK